MTAVARHTHLIGPQPQRPVIGLSWLEDIDVFESEHRPMPDPAELLDAPPIIYHDDELAVVREQNQVLFTRLAAVARSLHEAAAKITNTLKLDGARRAIGLWLRDWQSHKPIVSDTHVSLELANTMYQKLVHALGRGSSLLEHLLACE